MTLEGTNTYVVEGYVIDPGPNDAGHLERVREAAGGEIEGVLLTHGHADHSAGVEALGVPLLWGRPGGDSEMEAMRRALEGDPIEPSVHPGADSAPNRALDTHIGPFTVIATPGHAADHVAFVRDRVCFCGDLILGSGSSIVPPAAGGGSLSAYMASLATLDELDLELLAPGHGPWITEPQVKIAEYIAHRAEREARLIGALARGERSRAALVAEVWDDVPQELRPAAALAMQAHLEKLAAEGWAGVGELVE